MDNFLCNNFYRDKKVLVTGHTGFKGGWLCAWLIKMGSMVTGYALPPNTTPNFWNACGLDGKMNSIIGDVRNISGLSKVIHVYGPDIVFHLAAQPLVRRSYVDPVETYHTNIMGTVNLLEACRESKTVKAIINVTSDKCYENKKGLPNTEESILGGFDPYSSSKACSEMVTSAYLNSFFTAVKQDGALAPGLASARAGNVLGGGDWSEDRLIPDCVRALQERGKVKIRYPNATRPWQHVLDPLYGYLLLGEKLYKEPVRFSGSWNFGPDAEGSLPVSSLLSSLKEIWGDSFSWEVLREDGYYESKYLKLDCSKAKEHLGWKPVLSMENVIQKTAEWYQAYYSDVDVRGFTDKQLQDYMLLLGKGE